MKNILLLLILLFCAVPKLYSQNYKYPQEEVKISFSKNSKYHFDGSISRKVLENYLDRSATMGYFLVYGKPENYEFPYREDDIRLIRNIGVKFIGRAIYRWGQESWLNDPEFLGYAQKMVKRVHAIDPEIIFQGCLFESVSRDIEKVKIPNWVFKEFDLPVEDRTFRYDSIIKRPTLPATYIGRGGVPIINNKETRMWYFFLAACYIRIGCEAFHLGQVELIGRDDKNYYYYSQLIDKIRSYAKIHARRHYVILDGHVPSGGMLRNGISLLDFNSFPMRIKENTDKPNEGLLLVGYQDAIYEKSKGCVAPSGWRCESLPYLVEFDNYGKARVQNVADTSDIFVWGWDEISWFAQQSEEYRNHWLVYAHEWIKRNDPNGHLEMPITRMITCPNETLNSYFANTRSENCPVGYSQEETIKKIWESQN